jgi:hypothetical protein
MIVSRTQEAPMRSLILITAAVVMFGCDPGFAQPAGSTRIPNAAPFGTIAPTTRSPATSATTPAPAPGTIPMAGASALGAIQLGATTPASIAPPAMGTITACAGAGLGVTPSSGIIDASSAVAISGVMATPILPGATVPPNLSFAPSMANGACNPAASAQYLNEFFNNTVIAPIPGLATTTGALYSEATIPTATTEAGASGLSPQIIVPTLLLPTTSPCVTSPTATTETMMMATTTTTAMATPTTPAAATMTTTTAATTTTMSTPAGMTMTSPSGLAVISSTGILPFPGLLAPVGSVMSTPPAVTDSVGVLGASSVLSPTGC